MATHIEQMTGECILYIGVIEGSTYISFIYQVDAWMK